MIVLKVNRDGDQWIKRLKEEYMALIKYVELNKADDNDWFKIEMKDQLGTKFNNIVIVDGLVNVGTFTI
jgi:hypothetical protein